VAWSFADVSADEQTWLAADYPLLAVQTIPIAPTHEKWIEDDVVGANDITSWTSRVDSDFPVLRSHDGYPGYVTKTDGVTTDSVWFLGFDLGVSVTFDCAFIIGHNFGTAAVDAVTLEISDDNTFRTSLTEIGDFGAPSDDTRLVDLSLAHGADGGRAHDVGADAGPNRYTARYVWLKLDNGAGDFVPQVGELVLAQRYQTKTQPSNPYDDIGLHDEVAASRTMGGVRHAVIHHQNRHDLIATFPAWEAARIADFKAWFKATRGNFVFIDKPTTAPAGWRMISKPTDLDMPSAGFTERTVSIFGEEQGTEAFFLENE